jgi:hypothetical protein
LRENFQQISKHCGEHILNLLWDAHQCPKTKIEEEKQALAGAQNEITSQFRF